ncbi:hypothetical protein D9M71_583620 [compost metagenome]
MPGIGEEQQDAVQAAIGDAVAQHFQGIAAVHANVGQALGHGTIEQGADAGTVHFDTDEVLLRRGRGHLQGGVAHAETDLEGTRCTAAEQGVEVLRTVGQLQAEFRPALVEAALLAFGHAPGTHHETLDGAVVARFAGFSRRALFFNHCENLLANLQNLIDLAS